MCKHDATEIFPRRSDLPEGATLERQVELFLKLFGQPTDYVICRKCGKIGHYIRSRRGGIRWHRDNIASYIENVFENAAECWQLVGKQVPYKTNRKP